MLHHVAIPPLPDLHVESVPNTPDRPITDLKPLYQQLHLERSAVTIVSPPQWRAVAQALQDQLRARGLPRAQLLSPDTPLPPGDIILLGNAIDNAAALPLYQQHFTLADAAFPGPGGYEVRSIHNPFGDGRGFLLLGGSDLDGLRQGAEALINLIERHGGILPPVLITHSRRLRGVLPDRQIRERLRRQSEDELRRGELVPNRIVSYAQLYFLSGFEFWGALFRDLVLGAVAGHGPLGDFQLRPTSNYFTLYKFVSLWDALEEQALFSDAERLAITNEWLRVAGWISGLRYLTDPTYAGNNHQTYAALSVHHAARYFKTYYSRTDFDPVLPAIDQVFQRHSRTYRTNDNAEGVGYRVARHVLHWALEDSHDEYLRDDHLRRLVDYIVATTDNRADGCTFGDSGEFEGVYRGGSYGIQERRAVQLASVAAWYYQSPACAWVHRWLQKGHEWFDARDLRRFVGEEIGARNWLYRYGFQEWEFSSPAYHCPLQPAVPAHLLGVQVVRLDGPARELSHAEQLPEWQAFDKIAFRRDFAPQSEYLVLEGAATLAHSHHDANTILRLTWRDRLVLVEGDEIKRLARYHNGLVIERNGVLEEPPNLPVMEAVAEGAEWSGSRTLLAGYNGTDWRRTILWRTGRYFLVVDDVLVRAGAGFRIAARWQTLGEVAVDGAGLTIHQDGERFLILAGDESRRELLPRQARYAFDRENFAGYEHAADGFPRLYEEVQAGVFADGDHVIFFNLIAPADTAPTTIERLGDTVWRLDDIVVGLQGVLDGTPSMAVAGGFVVHGNNVFSLEQTEVRPPGSDVAYQLQAGDNHLPAAAHSAAVARRAWTGSPAERPPHQAAAAIASARRSIVARETVVLPAGLLTLVADPALGVVAGCQDGTVAAFSPSGRPLWHVQVLGGIGALATADVDADARPEVVAGSRAGHTYLLDADGQVRQDWAFGRGVRLRPQRTSAVLVVRDDAGQAMILSGQEDESLYALAPSGAPRWRARAYAHAVTSLFAVPGPNGSTRVAVGTEYYTLSLFDLDGRRIWRVQHGPVGPLALCDLDGDGREEILYGHWTGVHALDPVAGRVLWQRTLAGETVGLIVEEESSEPRVIVLSDSGRLQSLDRRGSVTTSLDVGERATRLAAGGGLLAVGTERGHIVLVGSREWTILGEATLAGSIETLVSTADGFVAGTDRGHLAWIPSSTAAAAV